MALGTIVLTGAAGRVGAALRAPLRAAAERLVLADLVVLDAEAPNETVLRADLSDPAEAARVVGGADAVVHLAGVSDEAPFPDLVEGNVLGTQRVLEAARRAGVPRVVLASSNRLTGLYRSTETVSAVMPPRPDGLYGVSKVAVEALGRLYADKFGLDVVCLRIGSLEARPSEPRHLATWLSHRDCAGFVLAALTVPAPGFLAAYAVSDNARRFWELDERLGYTPVDDAASYGVPDTFVGPGVPQGGDFASPAFTLGYLSDVSAEDG
ncbi:NAD-dependent epimerase/dehydratase family protein [Actinomadura chibensis]|uniref:NAD(P)-dependent oxidoreductase n=1 Tax=Actinomadura chibensis TaxID=392828 RepID=A0A5D0NLG5_9ACTN|nr:NAD(P)-dependent oxidoreductase [Actinomadura chibensis]TYB45225.1 NAD(P)-dependent oxidoreductase [Actinomadura chibensis]